MGAIDLEFFVPAAAWVTMNSVFRPHSHSGQGNGLIPRSLHVAEPNVANGPCEVKTKALDC